MANEERKRKGDRESVAEGDLVKRRFSQFVVRGFIRQGYKSKGNGKKSFFFRRLKRYKPTIMALMMMTELMANDANDYEREPPNCYDA